jgi:hypothetical protein
MNCKCYLKRKHLHFARILWSFIQRPILVKKLQRRFFPNTRALLMVVPQPEEEEHTCPCPNTAALLMAVRNV